MARARAPVVSFKFLMSCVREFCTSSSSSGRGNPGNGGNAPGAGLRITVTTSPGSIGTAWNPY